MKLACCQQESGLTHWITPGHEINSGIRGLLSHRKQIPAVCEQRDQGTGRDDGEVWIVTRTQLFSPPDLLLYFSAAEPSSHFSLNFLFFFFVFFPASGAGAQSKFQNFSQIKNLHRSAEIQVLLSAMFLYCFSIFLTSILYKSSDWKKLWNKMVIIILIIWKQIEDILRFSSFLSFSTNIIFTTSSCKSTEVAFGEKTFINKFPARCYSRFGSNFTSCLQLPILPCSKKPEYHLCHFLH